MKFRELWRKLTKAPPFFGYGRQIDRWRVEVNGYRFDRRFFIACLLLLAILEGIGWYGVYFVGPKPPYGFVECENPYFNCENPLYKACRDVMNPAHEGAVLICGENCDRDVQLCTRQHLRPGERLELQPPLFAQQAFGWRWAVLAWTFILNDLIANKRLKKLLGAKQ